MITGAIATMTIVFSGLRGTPSLIRSVGMHMWIEILTHSVSNACSVCVG